MKQSEQTARSTRQERMETMRRTFLESTVRVVAQYGLERTTTKLISTEANLNEAYIYRCFESKEMLLREAFLEEDKRFVQLLRKTLPVMRREHCSWKERAFLLWQSSWAFILEKEATAAFIIVTITPPAAKNMPTKIISIATAHCWRKSAAASCRGRISPYCCTSCLRRC